MQLVSHVLSESLLTIPSHNSVSSVHDEFNQLAPIVYFSDPVICSGCLELCKARF